MSNPDHDRRQRLRPLAAHRRGIALILAIVILVGLLLLGLPFFMSQSTSLSGARNFRSAEQASTGSDSAMRVGLAVGIAVMQDHLRPAVNNEALSPREWTRLDETGLVMKPDVIKLGADNNRAVINLDSLGIFNYETTTQGVPANRLLASLTIEDESGKLDPNTMSVAMWHQLIQRVFDPQKIGYQVDWDDDEVVCSKASDGFDQNTGIHHWRQNNDPDHFGQLAQALAEQPRRMPGGRITELEQLLLADTGHSASRNDKNLKKGYDEPSAPSPTFGLRRPLTRTELNRLRPYLSLYNPAPGRQGLIDFGTVVQVQSNNNGSVNTNVLWDVPSWLIGRNQPWGWGSVLACQAPDQKSWKYGWLTVQTGGAWYIQGSADQPQPGQNSAGALLAPPVLNVNAASKTVLGALGINKDSLPRDEKKLEKRWHLSKLALASDMPTAPMTSLMNESWIPNFDQNKLTAFNAWHLQDPFRMMERIGGSDCPVSLPPLGIASTGIFTVTAAAAATDGQGRQDARSLRRMVIQASSQERMVERRWQTQDDMYALAAQRFTNAVDTWPHPVNRVLPLGAYDPTATNPDQAHCWPADVPAVTDALLNDQHMFRPTTLPNWATNLSNGVDWAMDFGAKTPLKTNTETVLRTTPGLVNPTLSPDIGFQDLRPDGLRLPSDGRRVATSAVGPLQRRDNNTQEMAGRHFSLWVKPENEWINSATPIPIFEARVNAGLAIKPIKRKPDIVNNIGEVIATGEIE